MKDMVSSDFFVVPTVFFRVLFLFVILSHDRRRPVRVAMTEYPTAEWVACQLLEAVGQRPQSRSSLVLRKGPKCVCQCQRPEVPIEPERTCHR